MEGVDIMEEHQTIKASMASYRAEISSHEEHFARKQRATKKAYRTREASLPSYSTDLAYYEQCVVYETRCRAEFVELQEDIIAEERVRR